MLTLQQIKADPARTIERLAIKGFDGKEPIAKVLQLDEQRRTLQLETIISPPSLTARPHL